MDVVRARSHHRLSQKDRLRVSGSDPGMALRRVTSLARLYDFIATVVLCAPDGFPKRAYLAEEDQPTLDRAFAELNAGMEFVRKEIKDEVELARSSTSRWPPIGPATT